MLRKMVKKRYDEDGEEVPIDPPDSRPGGDEIDIKKHKKVFYERGRGPAYQKTIYEFAMSEDQDGGEQREYEEDDLDIEITGGGGTIHYKKNTKKVILEAGRGPSYQKTVLAFDNSADNETREVRIQKVPRDRDGSAGTIEVERVVSYQVEVARGPSYQLKKVTPNSDEDKLYEDD